LENRWSRLDEMPALSREDAHDARNCFARRSAVLAPGLDAVPR
jgi:hypothetical protein